MIRVRFAPSPTGHVHIGNIRVAIFNWLFARHHGGNFLLRIEDTDRERSTPEAIHTLLEAMQWLGLTYDEEPIYQSRQLPVHTAAARRLIEAGYASQIAEDAPIVLHLDAKLYHPSFITEPREEATIDLSRGEIYASPRALFHVTTSDRSGESFTTPYAWDALDSLQILLEDGSTLDGIHLREHIRTQCNSTEQQVALATFLPACPKSLRFRRRYVYFEDLVLGRLEKPLESLRDFVIVRSDGTPVFHLANVCDDITQKITHILRGNDHVENTFRHLFLFHALGATPPQYGHFPMIVNAQGKPYSKRDGDAYVGDFQAKGILPECLFNFLALCGWSPDDGREIMTREEMIAAFSLEAVSASPAQFNLEKLLWMNGQYIMRMQPQSLLPLLQAEWRQAGYSTEGWSEANLLRLVELQRERIRTLREIVPNTHYFFSEGVTLDEKAKKVLSKKEGAGMRILHEILPQLESLPVWNEAELEKVITRFTETSDLKMGDVAQPLRAAVTGGTTSPGIWETMALIGRDRCLRRIKAILSQPLPS